MDKGLEITVQHGERYSVYYVVDPFVPEEEQPCVLASFRSLEKAEQYVKWAHVEANRLRAMATAIVEKHKRGQV